MICLFGLGVALGCDYPTAHMIISESIPSNSRGKLVLGAFGFQAVGALGGTGVGYLVLSYVPDARRLALDVRDRDHPGRAGHRRPLLHHRKRRTGCKSAARIDHAETEALRLLLRAAAISRAKSSWRARREAHGHGDGAAASRPCSTRDNRRATILASVPWFLQDLGTYGIGIFTPTILAAAIGNKPDHVRSVSDLILNDILAAKGAALITVLLIVGIMFAVCSRTGSAASGCRSSASSAARRAC